MSEDEFVAAVKAHQALFFRVAYTVLGNSEDCADALQDALECAWRRLPSLRDPAAFRGWMARIVINCSYTMLRKRRLRTVPLDETLPAPQVEDPALAEALARLDDGLRLPLVLHYMEEMSVAEVAQAMRLPQGTIKNRLQRGRRRLKAILIEEGMS